MFQVTFSGFTNSDFSVFSIEGFEPRMRALKTLLQPKLNDLGHYFAPALSAITNDEMIAHVAKHARRKINPPIDTWVAFANNPRGYKMLPHFQVGLWGTHLFIWYAVIYEAPNKIEIGNKLEANINDIYSNIPDHFVWSDDHTKPSAIQHGKMSKGELLELFRKPQKVKKAEILCGLHIDREKVVNMNPSVLLQTIEDALIQLVPLYKKSF